MVVKPSVWDLIGPGPCTRRVGDNKKNLREAVCLHRPRNERRARRQNSTFASPRPAWSIPGDPVGAMARQPPVHSMGQTRSYVTRSGTSLNRLGRTGNGTALFGFSSGAGRCRSRVQTGTHFVLHNVEEHLGFFERSFFKKAEDLDFFSNRCFGQSWFSFSLSVSSRPEFGRLRALLLSKTTRRLWLRHAVILSSPGLLWRGVPQCGKSLCFVAV